MLLLNTFVVAFRVFDDHRLNLDYFVTPWKTHKKYKICIPHRQQQQQKYSDHGLNHAYRNKK